MNWVLIIISFRNIFSKMILPHKDITRLVQAFLDATGIKIMCHYALVISGNWDNPTK